MNHWRVAPSASDVTKGIGDHESISFADPREGLAFGYSMNRMGYGVLLNERGQSLVDAAYRALGYDSNAGGVWARGTASR